LVGRYECLCSRYTGSICCAFVLQQVVQQMHNKSNQWNLCLPRGVTTGWTGVDMFTPLLPEVVPEIDANLVSFYSGGGGGRSVMVWRMKQICCFRWAPKAKRFSASGAKAPDPLTGALHLDPAGGSAPRPRYRFALHALAMHVHPTFFDLASGDPPVFTITTRACSRRPISLLQMSVSQRGLQGAAK